MAEERPAATVDADAEASRIVADAESAALEAEALLGELEHRVAGGDASVTRDQIEKAEKDSSWLRKLVAGAKTRADALREENRQSRLRALAEEVDAFDPGRGYEAAAKDLADKIEEFVQLFVNSNEAVDGFISRASSLGVTSSQFPSSKDAYMSLGSGRLSTRYRSIERQHSGLFVQQIIEGVFRKMHDADNKVGREYFEAAQVTGIPLEDVYAQLEKAGSQHLASTEGHSYYRAAEWFNITPSSLTPTWKPTPRPDGGVFSFAEDLPLEEQRRRGVVKITEAEARGE